MHIRKPRLLICVILAATSLAAVALVAPQQLPVSLYKLNLITMGGCLGYWLDRWVFPYSRPDGYLVNPNWRIITPTEGDANCPVVPGYETVFAAALIRRALVMLGVMLGVGLGL